MSTNFEKAREIVRGADVYAWERVVAQDVDNACRVTVSDRYLAQLLSAAYVAGYSCATRDAMEHLRIEYPSAYECPRCGQRITGGKPCGCGARVAEVPAAYDAGFRLNSQDESDEPDSLLLPCGLVPPPSDADVARMVRPSQEAVGLLARLVRRELDAGHAEDAAELLAIALCVREMVRG